MTPKIDVGVGCDIVEVSRIQKMMLHPEALKKAFHPSELTKFEAEHLAGIFAAKEAGFKALALKSNSWLLLEIKNGPNGKPLLIMSKDINNSNIISLDCSISHDGVFAAAIVVVLKTGGCVSKVNI